MSELIAATKRKDLNKVKELIKSGVNLNAKDTFGGTALIIASNIGHTEIVKLLIKSGSDVNIASNDGRTALMKASLKGNTDIVKLLLENGADSDIQNNGGSTALIYACKIGNTDIIKLLLKNGANPDIQDKLGRTALIEASWPHANQRNNSPGIIKLLIDAGADLDIQERHGVTALMEALMRGHMDIVKLLIESDADPDVPNKQGRKPIDNPQVQEIYYSYVRRKLNQAENRMALAKLAKKLNDDGTILDEGILIKISKEIPFLSDKQMNVIDKRILAESIRSSYKSPDLDKMVELYREQLKNPKLLPKHRKLIRKKKRTRKIKENIPLASSDISTSRKSRSLRSSEELDIAIKMSIQEAKTGSKKNKKKKSKKKKSKKKSKNKSKNKSK